MKDKKTSKPNKKPINNAKTVRIILFIAFLFFGIAKFLVPEETATEVFGKIGGSTSQYFTGTYQVISAILVIMPQTAFIGALLIAVSMIVALILHLTILEINFLVILAIIFLLLALHVMKHTRKYLFKK